MLKAIYKVRNNLQFEIEAKEQKDVFEQIASIEEVFGETVCGLCKKNNLHFRVRNVDDNNFYEFVCGDCGGKLALSQNKKGGTLYPQRKLKNGLPAKVDDEGPFDFNTRGWHKWVKPKDTPQQANNTKKK